MSKATKTLDAICLLCEGGFTEDALILSRTILELCIHLYTIASAETIEQKRQRAESLIFDGERQRGEKFKEFAALKEQGKCLSWLDGIDAYNTPFEKVTMPTGFVPPKSLKRMAKDLGDEIECWYYFIYWSVSKLTHPSVIGGHSYFGEVDAEEEVSRVLVALTMHFYMTIAMLGLLELDRLRPPLEEAMQQFVSLSQG